MRSIVQLLIKPPVTRRTHAWLRSIALLLIGFTGLLPTAGAAQSYETIDGPYSQVKFANIELATQQLHYAYAGSPDKPGLLFIHGTPGSWQAFSSYLSDAELQQHYFMVSVDRPGWGKSVAQTQDREQQRVAPALHDFANQSAAMAAILQRYPDKQWLLIGHSLGASIAPRLALDRPDAVSGMLLLAGSLTPEFGAARWYNVAASLLVVKWMLPASLKYSNDEIMALKRELAALDGELISTQLDTDVVIMQGMKDKLVSPGNAQRAQQRWQHSFASLRVIELPDAGHFLPWDQYAQVSAAIRSFELAPQSVAQCDQQTTETAC